jgi:hypothetical protein
VHVYTMTITLEVEHRCDSSVAIEEAVASCLCNEEWNYQDDGAPAIEFRISKVVFADGAGVVDAGRSADD